MARRFRNLLRILLAVGIIIVCVSFYVYWKDLRFDMIKWGAEISGRMGYAQYPAIILLTGLGVAAMIPSTIFTFVSVLLYGPWIGFLLMLAGQTLGASIAYYFSRFIAQKPFMDKINEIQKRYTGLDTGWINILVRLSGLPFAQINYCVSLLSIPFRKYFFTTLIGGSPLTLFAALTYAGIFKNISKRSLNPAWFIVPACLYVLTMSLPLWFRKLKSRKKKQVKSRPILFTDNIIIFNTCLHLFQVCLNTPDGNARHIPGILAGWGISTLVLLMLRDFEVRRKKIVRVCSFLIFIVTIVFNFMNDLNWHLYGIPLSYQHFSEGATRLFKYSGEHSETASALDVFMIVEIILSIASLAGIFLRFPRPLNDFFSNNRRRILTGVTMITVLLYLFYPLCRLDGVPGFIYYSPLFQTGVTVKNLQHIPLRHYLPEKDFHPEALVEIPAGVHRNVLFIVYESIGAKYMSFYGNENGIPAPNFKKLSRVSIVGRNHYSVCGGSSIDADWSTMTGLYPPCFGESPVNRDSWIKHKNIFYYFRRAGYATGGFYGGNSNFREYFKLFKHIYCDVYYDKNHPAIKKSGKNLNSDQAALQILIKKLEELPENKHFMYFYRTSIPHWPYIGPDNKKDISRYEKFMFDAREPDKLLGEIIEKLKSIGRYKNTIIVVTADHGQAFKQHENLTIHSNGVYEELTRVPMLIALPGVLSDSIEIKTVTSHVDLLPSILSLAGIAEKDIPQLEGYALDKTLPPGRMVFMTNGEDGYAYAVVHNQFKLMQKRGASGVKLFNLKTDPGETKNVNKAYPGIAQGLLEYISEWEKHRRRGPGRSRLVNPSKTNKEGIELAGNAEVEIYLNRKKAGYAADFKRLFIPLNFLEGKNEIILSTLARNRGYNTGLRIFIRGGGEVISPGYWWGIADDPSFILEQQWLTSNMDEYHWRPASLEYQFQEYYGDFQHGDWLRLERERPRLLRLEFYAKNGKLLTDRVDIMCDDSFKMFINGKLYGSGTRWNKRYQYRLPRLKSGSPVDIFIEARDDGGKYGMILSGKIRGEEIISRPDRWVCLNQMDYSSWQKLPVSARKSLKWRKSVEVKELQPIGPWQEGAVWLWAQNQKGGRVLFRHTAGNPGTVY